MPDLSCPLLSSLLCVGTALSLLCPDVQLFQPFGWPVCAETCVMVTMETCLKKWCMEVWGYENIIQMKQWNMQAHKLFFIKLIWLYIDIYWYIRYIRLDWMIDNSTEDVLYAYIFNPFINVHHCRCIVNILRVISTSLLHLRVNQLCCPKHLLVQNYLAYSLFLLFPLEVYSISWMDYWPTVQRSKGSGAKIQNEHLSTKLLQRDTKCLHWGTLFVVILSLF